MIKAQELRIGSVIQFQDESDDIVRVEYFYMSDGDWFVEWKKVAGQSTFLSGNSLLAEFKTIPLTPEWLERCGFERGDAYDISHTLARGEENYWRNDRFIWHHYLRNKSVGESYEHIKNVHQLQNLFHALTGEELIINESA